VGAEDRFAVRLAGQLRPMMPRRYEVGLKRSVLYAISFDDRGGLQLGQNEDREPTRGGGTGFEQDLLIFERSAHGDTAIIPRVSVELKFGAITTHDSMVYSEKARRIRSVYPFVRYGLILGGFPHVPARTLRLGTEFDFIVAVPDRVGTGTLTRLAKLLRTELRLSRRLTAILRGREKVAALHRSVRYARSM